MHCKSIIFIIVIMLFSSGAYAAADVQKMHHDTAIGMLEEAEGIMNENPEGALSLIATWQSLHNIIIKIEEDARMRRIIFVATRLLFDRQRLNSINLENSSFCKSSFIHSDHHKHVCTIIKNRLEAFEAKPLDGLNNIWRLIL